MDFDLHEPDYPVAVRDVVVDEFLDYLFSDAFRPVDYTTWVQSNGKPIKVADMDARHIDNAICMLNRNIMDGYYDVARAQVVRNYITAFKEELQRRVEPFMENKIKNVVLKVVGVTFANGNGTSRQQIISHMGTGTPVELRRERNNPYDKNAIAVFADVNGTGMQIGYIGKEYAKIMADMMDHNRQFTVRVQDISRYKETWSCALMVNEV